MQMYGIDVSTHNGTLNHAAIKNSGVKFAMIRAGYGSKTVDKQFKRNMDGFLNEGVHIGAYWFMYSLSVSDALREADAFNEALAPYKGRVAFPVACDFEYDTERYMKQCGVTPTKRLNTDIVKAFCDRMKQHGWYVVNYANVDYINNHFYNDELSGYDLWLARWGVSSAGYNCGIWQYTSDGVVNGSSARTDLNYCYKDYPSIIKAGGYNGMTAGGAVTPQPTKTIEELANEVFNGVWGNGVDRKEALEAAGYDYAAVQAKVNEMLAEPVKGVDELANEVLNGYWGNGTDRKAALEAAGYDYAAVQAKVNELLGKHAKTIEELAKEVINGDWNNGTDRKAALEAAGYDYAAVQEKVNELLG